MNRGAGVRVVVIAADDWHDADAYVRFLPGDRRCFAWEWLRRTPTYVRAWRQRLASDRFGLVRLENPAFDAFSARPIWNDVIDRAVLHADGLAAAHGDLFDISRLAPLATLAPAVDGGAHILLSDGLHSIRIDLAGCEPMRAPFVFDWHIIGVSSLGPQIAALAQFAALARNGCFSRVLHPTERRAARWIRMLRVHDALGMGASTREIVAELFAIDTSLPRWRIDAGPWRLRAQRLAAGARACLAMGPAGWLGDGPA